MKPGGVTPQPSLPVTYLLEKFLERSKRFSLRSYQPYKSDYIFDKSETVVLSQIDDKVLGGLCFECASCVRCFQEELTYLEDELIRIF